MGERLTRAVGWIAGRQKYPAGVKFAAAVLADRDRLSCMTGPAFVAELDMARKYHGRIAVAQFDDGLGGAGDLWQIA